jgi:ABC-2 type transport system ATP-binding protein
MLGLLRPDAGSCVVLGTDAAKRSKELYRRVGVVLEHNGFNANLPVMDNLTFFARARGVPAAAMRDYFKRYWSATAIGADTRSVKFFSRGQKMQCALCRAFLGSPDIFFLDEPAVALDIEAYDQFCAMVREAHARGATMIISSHQLDAIEDLCTAVGVLERGRVIMLDSPTLRAGVRTWLVRTDEGADYTAVIREETGVPVERRDGHYRFVLRGEQDPVIAAMIARLSATGISVFEVRPERDGVRASIRSHFTESV